MKQITADSFEEMHQESLRWLDEYILSQKTERQIGDAKHRKKHIEMNRNYYRGRAEAGEDLFLCSKCGAIETATYYEPIHAELIENRVCFHCNHWSKIANEQKPGRLIINGQIYGDGGNKPQVCPREKQFLGFGGQLWRVKQGDREWETNNLWHGGAIPEEFRMQLPDNAEFLMAMAEGKAP